MIGAGIAVFTVVEVVTLAVWFALARAGRRVAAVVLFVGLLLEHIIQYNVAHGRELLDLSRLPLRGLVLFTSIETVVWVAWLAISAAAGPAVGLVFIIVLLVGKHAVSDNVIRGRPPFAFRYFSNGSIVTASVLEGAGAQLWLANVLAGSVLQGILILAVFSFLEHTILTMLARRELANA